MNQEVTDQRGRNFGLRSLFQITALVAIGFGLAADESIDVGVGVVFCVTSYWLIGKLSAAIAAQSFVVIINAWQERRLAILTRLYFSVRLLTILIMFLVLAIAVGNHVLSSSSARASLGVTVGWLVVPTVWLVEWWLSRNKELKSIDAREQ